MQSSDPLVLFPAVQNYHWGKIGQQSMAARLLGTFDPNLPYAEIWYGSHPKAPSLVQIGSTRLLLDLALSHNPISLLGMKSVKNFGETLPFLAKVLSIERALSLQAHPTKAQAQILHARDPSNYPDVNHKPEIAIALTEVTLLHGWIGKEQMLSVLRDFPVLDRYLKKSSILSSTSSWDEQVRKDLVKALFAAPALEIEELARQSLDDINKKIRNSSPSDAQQLFLTLAEQITLSDVGLFVALFLRLLKLSPGESIYTPAGVIHAYLSGDLFECMANSDNVIRAGLTPKFQDVAALLEFANFKEGQSNIQKTSSQGSEASSFFVAHYSEAQEFEVYMSKTDALGTLSGQISYPKKTSGPELLIALAGNFSLATNATPIVIKQGQALLVPACYPHVTLELQQAKLARVLVPNML